MADTQSSSAPAASPAPRSLANWTYPRLPQPIDIIEGMGGGGGGGGPSPSTSPPQMSSTATAGSAAAYSRGDHRHPSDTSRVAVTGGGMTGALTLSGPPTANLHAANKGYIDGLVTTLEARIAALESGGGGPTLTAPVITSSLTASGQVGVAFSYTIIATGNPVPTVNATSLPAGLSFAAGVISGTPSAAATAGHNVTLTATNSQGTDTKTLVLTIAAASAGPWQVTFSFGPGGIPTNFGGGANIPLANWTGWSSAYDADMTDALYDTPNMAAMPVNLYAQYAGQSEVLVDFDNWTGTSGINKITTWGYLAPTHAIQIKGSNSTSNPIQLRLVKH